MDRKWWTLLVVCAATFMLLLDVTIVIVALPEIQHGLHGTFADVQWVVDAYALTLASLLLTAGSLADRYGRRLLFTIGLVIFTVGSLICGLAQSPLMLIISRSVQGIGGAIMFATSLALLANSFRGKDRGVAFGVWGAITGIAVALGPVLGGVITSDINWRGIFLVNLPIGVVAIAITLWRVDESKTPHASRPDWAGFVILTAGLVSLVYGLIRASEISWSDPGVEICLGLAVVLLGAFVIVERRAVGPMFDLSLFRVPTFSGGLMAAFAMNGSLYALLLYLVLYLQDDLGYSALGTGVGHRGRAAEQPYARPLAHRSRPGSHRNRVVPDVWPGRHHVVDPPRSGIHRGRLRKRNGEPAVGFDSRRSGDTGTIGDGFGRQHDLPPDRDRGRDRGLRDDLHGLVAPQPWARPVEHIWLGRQVTPDNLGDPAGQRRRGHQRDARGLEGPGRLRHPLQLHRCPQRPPRRQWDPGAGRSRGRRDPHPQQGLRGAASGPAARRRSGGAAAPRGACRQRNMSSAIWGKGEEP
jgi:MFS family permease